MDDNKICVVNRYNICCTVCPSPWVEVGGNCYQMPSITQPTDPATAQAACTSLNSKATLPIFHSGLDWDVFMKYLGYIL